MFELILKQLRYTNSTERISDKLKVYSMAIRAWIYLRKVMREYTVDVSLLSKSKFISGDGRYLLLVIKDYYKNNRYPHKLVYFNIDKIVVRKHFILKDLTYNQEVYRYYLSDKGDRYAIHCAMETDPSKNILIINATRLDVLYTELSWNESTQFRFKRH